MKIYVAPHAVPEGLDPAPCCIHCSDRLVDDSVLVYITKSKIPAKMYLIFCNREHALAFMSDNDLEAHYDNLVDATRQLDDPELDYEELDPEWAEMMLPYLIQYTE